jgi:hypothetical protein
MFWTLWFIGLAVFMIALAIGNARVQRQNAQSEAIKERLTRIQEEADCRLREALQQRSIPAAALFVSPYAKSGIAMGPPSDPRLVLLEEGPGLGVSVLRPQDILRATVAYDEFAVTTAERALPSFGVGAGVTEHLGAAVGLAGGTTSRTHHEVREVTLRLLVSDVARPERRVVFYRNPAGDTIPRGMLSLIFSTPERTPDHWLQRIAVLLRQAGPAPRS